MKTLLALAALAAASFATTAIANDAPDFDFSSQATMLSEDSVIDLDTTDMGNAKPLPVTRSINFALIVRGHKPDEAFSKITEAAATMCRKHKGHVRNLHYFHAVPGKPRNDVMTLLEGENARQGNALGVRVSCVVGRG
ncbi:MAG TPA: hypothetical protein VK519_14405 [Pinirhizobacter sp.]|uniref:hypothetical protein n=1 Tax=Pinirhizobacter sp. TaxID=2950432 RepID=UPI002C8355E6|nr:hypothetical protein [Pinirhizobacter sp.]HMH69102.1 hypothetical protein [Pinirhizobacter sp.]